MPRISEEAVEAALGGAFEVFKPSINDNRQVGMRCALEAARPAILSDLRRELLGDEARETAGRAAYLDFDPDGDWDTLDHPLQMTWEGNTAAGIIAALDSLADAEGEQP